MAAKTTVGDYVTLQRGTTYKGNLVGKPGPALLGLGAIQPGGGFREGDYKTYGGECPPKLMLFPGDLFVSLKGATKDGKMIGSVARVPSSVSSGRLTQDTVKLEFGDSSTEAKNFLYWVLRTPQYREYCDGRATGSAVVALSRDDFLTYPVPPVTTTRKRIVELLETLDSKIELNRRMNATLEAMAQALFKSWFVKFEPVHAKLHARPLPGMDDATTALFPATFEGSGSKQIPSGWTIETVGEIVDCVGGGTPSTAEPKYWEDGTHHWATPKDFSSLQAPVLLDTDRKLTDAGIAKISSGLLPVGTLLLSSRAPVGYLAITAIPVAINQGFIAIKCNERASNFFMLNWCQTNMAEIESRATGTTFAEISKQNFRPLPVVVPPEKLMTAFTTKVAPLYAQISTNLRQSSNLANLRDTLLPKLFSGRLGVMDVDEVAGALE
ncbi:restriction endonuclease subunit S [Variovorax sp. CCNWLW225]|uniref:restriction endonuclease subunit S n=1 Tax=Variovorax sp. CCNWLW225 TaxID=3127462 RepID=UPI00307708D0